MINRPRKTSKLGNFILHFASLAKYVAAFIRPSRSSVTGCSSRFRLRTPISHNSIVSLPAVVA